MTHTEIVNEFLIQKLKKGDIIEIELRNGNIYKGTLTFKKVLGKKMYNGEVCESRIGIIPLSAKEFSIPKITIQYYSKNIFRISKSG